MLRVCVPHLDWDVNWTACFCAGTWAQHFTDVHREHLRVLGHDFLLGFIHSTSKCSKWLRRQKTLPTLNLQISPESDSRFAPRIHQQLRQVDQKSGQHRPEIRLVSVARGSNCSNYSIHTRWPRSIAKLVQITPITMVFVGDISIVNGIINQLITWGAPPCSVCMGVINQQT